MDWWEKMQDTPIFDGESMVSGEDVPTSEL
jgi:hypothetical protein